MDKKLQGDILGAHYEQIALEQLRTVVVPGIEKWWHAGDTTKKPASDDLNVTHAKSKGYNSPTG